MAKASTTKTTTTRTTTRQTTNPKTTADKKQNAAPPPSTAKPPPVVPSAGKPAAGTTYAKSGGPIPGQNPYALPGSSVNKPGGSMFDQSKWFKNVNNWSYMLQERNNVLAFQALGVNDAYQRHFIAVKFLCGITDPIEPGADLVPYHEKIDIAVFPTLSAASSALLQHLKDWAASEQPTNSLPDSGSGQDPAQTEAMNEVARKDYENFRVTIGNYLKSIIPVDNEQWANRRAFIKTASGEGTDDLKLLWDKDGRAEFWIEQKFKPFAAKMQKSAPPPTQSNNGQSPSNQKPVDHGDRLAADLESMGRTHGKAYDTEEAIRADFTIDLSYKDKKTGRVTHHPYLLAAGCVLLFRLKYGMSGGIVTELVSFELDKFAISKTTITVNGAVVATGIALITKPESERAKWRYVQMSETHSTRRALAFAGIGTSELIDDDIEDDAISDAASEPAAA